MEKTIKRLRRGESNRFDRGGVLQTNNIHLAVAGSGEVTKSLAALKASPATARAKAKFVLTRCADDILPACEAHFPATIANLCDRATRPPTRAEAHDRNDQGA
jgi:hypothetical protein